jgi:tRNA-specific 2-thiouridylase
MSKVKKSRRSGSRSAGQKVLVALSGGIDSAVSAYLLIKQGYQVEAAFMKNWSSTTGLKVNECPWLVDRQDALRVAAFLRIPLHTLDFEKSYEKNVLNYFFKEYAAGRTPNPDVMCNKEIKFKLLYNWAMKNGFDYLATGHYAKIGMSGNRMNRIIGKGHSLLIHRYQDTPINGHATLFRSVDEFKDQTYFIYNIKTEQLPHVLFPIGGMKKPQVRSLARKIGLPNAEKKESMGLCFVGRIRLKDFLEQKLKPKPGKIVDQNNDIIGTHQGLYTYTIGQRQGIKVGGNGPYYVLRKDLKKNVLYVTNDPDDKGLETREIEIHSVNWIDPIVTSRKRQETSLTGRYRHQGKLVPLTISLISKDHFRVIFHKPQKAVASGQSLVLYKGKECVGGGVIV